MRWRHCSSATAEANLTNECPAALYRDHWLLLVDKPAGLLSQPGLGPHQQDSLITRLRNDASDLHLVHRLDRDTSGVILLAKGLDSLRRCSALFARRQIRKLYVADVEGCMSGSGRVALPLARLQRQPPRYGVHGDGKHASTRWRVQHSNPAGSRLWLCPLTGRSHQLRAHLAWIGHPIVGDPIYGSGSDHAARMHLHASALAFVHPFTGRRCRILCPALMPFPWL